MIDTTFWRIKENARIDAQAEDAHMENRLLKQIAMITISARYKSAIMSVAQTRRRWGERRSQSHERR